MVLRIPERVKYLDNCDGLTIEEGKKVSRSVPLLSEIPVDLDSPVLTRFIYPKVNAEDKVVGYRLSDYYCVGGNPEPSHEITVQEFNYHIHWYSQRSVDMATTPEELAEKEVDGGLKLKKAIEAHLCLGLDGEEIPIEYYHVLGNIYGEEAYRKTMIRIDSTKRRTVKKWKFPFGRKEKTIVEPALEDVVKYLASFGIKPVGNFKSRGSRIYEMKLDRQVFTPERLCVSKVGRYYQPVERVILTDGATVEGDEIATLVDRKRAVEKRVAA